MSSSYHGLAKFPQGTYVAVIQDGAAVKAGPIDAIRVGDDRELLYGISNNKCLHKMGVGVKLWLQEEVLVKLEESHIINIKDGVGAREGPGGFNWTPPVQKPKVDYEGVSPESALLATMHRHLTFLRIGMDDVIHALERRALEHDLSKYGSTEFAGFTRINQTARLHPYGSDEYKDSLASEKPTIDHHYTNNTHHPEFHQQPGRKLEDMGWLDIIEMVCDWWSAWQSYGQKQSWSKNLAIQQKRFDFTEQQWWLVVQVAGFLEKFEEEEQEVKLGRRTLPYLLYIDGDKYEWGAERITGKDVRLLVAVPEDADMYMKIINNPDKLVEDSTEIDLRGPYGAVRFSTQARGSLAGSGKESES